MIAARPLVYLVVNENIRDGLLQSQLIEPLKGSGLWERVRIVNILHPLARRYPREAPITTLRCGIPARLYQFRLAGLPDVLVSCYYALILTAVIPRGARVVARSYYSALSAWLLSFLKDIELVFDSRSQFIQENEASGRLPRHALAHRLWRSIEIQLLRRSARVVAVSAAQADYYLSVVPSASVEVVPCFGQPDFDLIRQPRRADERARMGFKPDDIVVCYYGSLDRKWNHVDLYKQFFVECLERGWKLCVVSASAAELVADARLQTPAAYIRRIDDPARARALLAACDYGVVIMRPSLDWESRLSVKFVEYVCAGLRVLVGQWVGAAASIARGSFAASAYILGGDEPRPPPDLQRVDQSERVDIAATAEALFGHQRMRAIFDD